METVNFKFSAVDRCGGVRNAVTFYKGILQRNNHICTFALLVGSWSLQDNWWCGYLGRVATVLVLRTRYHVL